MTVLGETPTLLELRLGRRGPPTCRHRRELLGHGECTKGRVQPPGEPVKVGRTVETKRDVPTFLGLRVLTSFACALGESALPFMGSPRTAGQPHLFHRQPTTDNRPLPFKNQNSTIINRQFFLFHADGDSSAGRGGSSPTGCGAELFLR